MDGKEKITQESKDFIISVIKLYKKMGPEETRINVTIGPTRAVNYSSGNKVINARVLNIKEAEMLREMQKEIRQKNSEEIPQETLDAVENFSKKPKITKASTESKEQNGFKKIKRNLKNRYKKLKNKTYKLAGKTLDKVEKAQAFLKLNGKKVVSSIAVVALLAGASAHTVSNAVEGHETFEEYGSVSRIEMRMHDIITNEYRKALNNNNIETELNVIRPDREGAIRLRVTLKDPNDPNFEMHFMLNDFAEFENPRYMNQIARQYIKVAEDGDIIGETSVGKALNEVEELANKNDIIIKKGAITGKPNMDRVPERSPLSIGDER